MKVAEPRWVQRVVVDAIHLDQIREHGGLPGLRDEGLLESALARPRHKWTYKRRPDLASLAAAYGFGIAKNHPYRDGNKRVAFLTMVVFLGLNGFDLVAEEADVVTTMLNAAAGHCSEAELARWIRLNIVEFR
ncbi:type II toxin-antitoxin system death-on-curing family toxin [Gemmatimonadota bacterium]